MKSEFSEFSFGFALSFEIASAFAGSAIAGAPLFPSLLQEKLLGFDVSFKPLGWPLFLQFKLADYLTRSTASYWPEHHKPYYQASIYRRNHSDQHNLLVKLAESEVETYYAIPAFHTLSQFNSLFASNSIFSRTTFVPLNVLPLQTDNGQHHITFADNVMPRFKWHSAPGVDIKGASFGDAWLIHMRNQLSAHPRELSAIYFVHLRSTLIDILRDANQRSYDELPVDLDNTSIQIVFRDLRHILFTYFGVEPIILRLGDQQNR